MKASEGKPGRVFGLRLEDGDILPDCIERFAAEKGVSAGYVVVVGGVGEGEVVVGPRHSSQMPPEPMLLPIDGAHELAGVGLIAPDKAGKPVLHIHAALGRAGKTTAGCLRPGVKTWLVGEAILYEVLDVGVVRKKDVRSGFDLLEIGTI
ncbi:MAG: DNA-binding protein [Dehalococcoidia bacterium]